MIKNFYIGNFKAFGKTQKIPIKPITLIFGPNSSGKSSILQSLLFAQHILNFPHQDVHKINLDGKSTGVNLGGYSNYVHQCNSDNIITLGYDIFVENFLGSLVTQTGVLSFKTPIINLTILTKFKVEKSLEILEYTIKGDGQDLLIFSAENSKNDSRLICKKITKKFFDIAIDFFERNKLNVDKEYILKNTEKIKEKLFLYNTNILFAPPHSTKDQLLAPCHHFICSGNGFNRVNINISINSRGFIIIHPT